MEQMHCCSCLFCTFPRLVIKLGNSSVWQGSASFGCCFLLPLLSPVHLISCPVLKNLLYAEYFIVDTSDIHTQNSYHYAQQSCWPQIPVPRGKHINVHRNVQNKPTHLSMAQLHVRAHAHAPPPKCSATRTDERETYLSLLLLAVQLPVLDLQPGLGHALRPQLATLAQTHSAADERQLSQHGKCSRWTST